MWTSKLGNRFLKEEIECRDGEHHKALERLRREPGNASCAECGEPGTSWASVNLGVFICLRCADVHRALGTHVSKVKGCTGTYLWGPDEIAQMQRLGNAAAEARYGGDCGAARPGPTASKEERVELCRKKYEQLAWAPKAPPSEASSSSSARAPAAAPTPSSSVPSAAKAAVSPVASQAVAAAARQAPSPAVAPPARSVPDEINWDAIFRDIDTSPGRASPSGAHAAARRQEGAWPVPDLWSTRGPGALADPSSAGLDDFLGRCLAGPEQQLATAAPLVPCVVPAVGSLARAGSDSMWSGFGTW